jgi:hypothetical protein
MFKTQTTLFATAAMLVIGAAASFGQGLPPGLPHGTPSAAPLPALMMPPPLLARGSPSLRKACLEMNALRAGYFAYLRERLGLTPAQALLWDDVEATLDETNTAVRDDCAALPAEQDKPGLSQTLSVAERHLATRQQGLQRISGPLLKLYEGLSPEQREIMDRSVPPPMVL